jgi:hypothetical protein
MPTIDIPIWIVKTIKKSYHVNRINMKKFNSIYSGDAKWIAHWFYTQFDPEADNVTFDILGDFHETYMQPKHLSIIVRYPDGRVLPTMHIEYNEITGEASLQSLPSMRYIEAHGLRKNKKTKNTKKTKKSKRSKKTKVKKFKN